MSRMHHANMVTLAATLRSRSFRGLAVVTATMISTADARAASQPAGSTEAPVFAPMLADPTVLAGLVRDAHAAGGHAQGSLVAASASASALPEAATPQADTAETDTGVSAVQTAYGTADSLELEFALGPAFASDDTSIGQFGAGLHWFVADGISFGVFAEALYVDTNTSDAWGGGVGLLARWHFVRERDFSLFLEAGCGFALFSDDVPDGGTDHDFTPRAAIGATYAIADGVRVVGRAGWFHISNAQTGPSNPGLDSFAVTIGLSFTLGR